MNLSSAVPQRASKPEIRRVAAVRAFQWLVAGWQVFARHPGTWALMTFALIVVLALATVFLVPLPIVGPLVVPILFVMLLAGMLSAVEACANERAIRFTQLFDGFRRHSSGLALVGILFSVPLVLLALITMLAMSGHLIEGLLGDQLGRLVGDWLYAAAMFASLVVSSSVVALVALLIMLFALMGAPALVYFRGVPPLDALLLSLRACLRNPVPTIVFGVIVAVLFSVCLMDFLGTIVLSSWAIDVHVALLGLLVVIPVGVGGVYRAYQDLFAFSPALAAGAE